jgi:hypothetical protein
MRHIPLNVIFIANDTGSRNFAVKGRQAFVSTQDRSSLAGVY